MSRDDSTKIGTTVATLIGINAMIGAGIMALPSLIAHTAGPAGVYSFILSTISALLLGLSLARLAIVHPGKGWNYLYPSLWGGHLCGMFSATCYLSGIVIAMGFLVQQAGVWLHPFFPMFSISVLGLLLLVLLALLVLAGANVSTWGQYIIAGCVVVPLVITSVFCWSQFSAANLTPFMPFGVRSIFSAAAIVLFSFLGFESISSLYSSLKNPTTTIVRATIFSIIIVGCVYLLFTAGILFSVPMSGFVEGINEPLSSVLYRIFPHYAFLPIFILVSGLFAIIGTLHSMIWSVSVLFFDVLSRARGNFIKKLLNNNVITQTRIVLFTSLCIAISSRSVQGEFLVSIAVILVIVSFLLSLAFLLFQKKEWKSGHNIITFGAFISGLILLYGAGMPLIEKVVKTTSNFL